MAKLSLSLSLPSFICMYIHEHSYCVYYDTISVAEHRWLPSTLLFAEGIRSIDGKGTRQTRQSDGEREGKLWGGYLEWLFLFLTFSLVLTLHKYRRNTCIGMSSLFFPISKPLCNFFVFLSFFSFLFSYFLFFFRTSDSLFIHSFFFFFYFIKHGRALARWVSRSSRKSEIFAGARWNCSECIIRVKCILCKMVEETFRLLW